VYSFDMQLHTEKPVADESTPQGSLTVAELVRAPDLHLQVVLDNAIDRTYEEYIDEARRFCTSRQVSYFRADVNVPFDELILRVFRRGGFLR